MSATVETTRLNRTIPGVGLIEFTESETQRAYWLTPEDGKRRVRLPSVTTILDGVWPKQWLLSWYAKYGEAAPGMSASAAERGTAVHAYIERYFTEGTFAPVDDYPEDVRPYLQGAAGFLWEHDPEPLAVEWLVCHPEMKYAGRLDLIATLEGARNVPVLLDFKSNQKGRIYPQAHVQASAYRLAHERCGGTAQIGRALLVGIAEDGTYDAVEGVDAVKLWGNAVDFYRDRQAFERQVSA